MRHQNRLLYGTAILWAALLLAALSLFSGAQARADAPDVLVDGQRLPADVPPTVIDGHVLVPLRGVFERFGADVSFDAASQIAIATLGGTTVKVSLRSADAWINGEHRSLDFGAREIAGRTLVPLRFVAQALGVSVDYDTANNTVLIVSGFKSGNFAAASANDANGSANFSVISAPKSAPSVQDESPQQGELIGSQYPQIYARFAGGTTAVNPASVTVSVDGQDVTGSSTVSSAYVSYTPQYALQTGQHAVEINGAADDGTPFSDSWTFRIDAGSSSMYMPSGGGGFGDGFSGGFTGFNSFLFPHFGFFPPGFSVFTPGPLFFVSGGVIEVIFFSQFFPFGNGFFAINGLPGTFPLSPWLGNPGFFWGFTTVPFGAHSHRAIIAAHFRLPNGRSIIVHSTAPMEIEGTRRQLPQSLRYAVLPRLVGRPTSPHHLVTFRRLEPVAATMAPGPSPQLRVFRADGRTITIRSTPKMMGPSIRSLPSMRRYPISPAMHRPGAQPGFVLRQSLPIRAPLVIHPPATTRAPVLSTPIGPLVPVQAPLLMQPIQLPAPTLRVGAKPRPK